MTRVPEDALALAQSKQDRQAEPSLVERRRPGRLENVSSQLIPLLRRSLPPEGEIDDEQDGLRSASGIALSTIIGFALWLGFILAFNYFFAS